MERKRHVRQGRAALVQRRELRAGAAAGVAEVRRVSRPWRQCVSLTRCSPQSREQIDYQIDYDGRDVAITERPPSAPRTSARTVAGSTIETGTVTSTIDGYTKSVAY